MMDALTIYGCVAATRHAGYFSFAVAVLGLAEAHYPGLRKAMRRVMTALANTWAQRLAVRPAPTQRRQPLESRRVPIG